VKKLHPLHTHRFTICKRYEHNRCSDLYLALWFYLSSNRLARIKALGFHYEDKRFCLVAPSPAFALDIVVRLLRAHLPFRAPSDHPNFQARKPRKIGNSRLAKFSARACGPSDAI
jgi:hypothetical protein